MVQYRHLQGAIALTYGFDYILGYFLRVYDTRIMINPRAQNYDEDFEAACRSSTESGRGEYFHCQTEPNPRGNQVSKETMRKFWRLYEVPENAMALLDQELSPKRLLGPFGDFVNRAVDGPSRE